MTGDESNQSTAAQWRAAVMEVEQARQAYADAVADERNAEDRQMDRLWLRLWRAERRRDDLLRQSE